ncbi:hypothetical protein ACN28S_18135 [Cystobacter fuscus]
MPVPGSPKSTTGASLTEARRACSTTLRKAREPPTMSTRPDGVLARERTAA